MAEPTDSLVARFPELTALEGDPAVGPALRGRDPILLHRALTSWLAGHGSSPDAAAVRGALAQRRRFIAPITRAPSMFTFNGTPREISSPRRKAMHKEAISTVLIAVVSQACSLAFIRPAPSTQEVDLRPATEPDFECKPDSGAPALDWVLGSVLGLAPIAAVGAIEEQTADQRASSTSPALAGTAVIAGLGVFAAFGVSAIIGQHRLHGCQDDLDEWARLKAAREAAAKTMAEAKADAEKQARERAEAARAAAAEEAAQKEAREELERIAARQAKLAAEVAAMPHLAVPVELQNRATESVFRVEIALPLEKKTIEVSAGTRIAGGASTLLDGFSAAAGEPVQITVEAMTLGKPRKAVTDGTVEAAKLSLVYRFDSAFGEYRIEGTWVPFEESPSPPEDGDP